LRRRPEKYRVWSELVDKNFCNIDQKECGCIAMIVI
jgi:hypothetical protein